MHLLQLRGSYMRLPKMNECKLKDERAEESCEQIVTYDM